MIILRSIDAPLSHAVRDGAVAVGNFDGVHLGHARLIERLRAMARRVGGPAVALTFDPPPTRVLRPSEAPEPLLWLDRKLELFAELGLDAAVVLPTDRRLLDTEARDFFDDVVRGRLAARAMVEGPNFFFGRDRSGNVDSLRRFCAESGMLFEAAEPVEIDGQIVSSTRIRALVMAGRLDAARAMLGRPYRIRGEVVHGAGRGATLGFPTANLSRIDTLLPGEGIYAARARTPRAPREIEERWHPAAVSLGSNPTFDDGKIKVEAFFIGFEGDLYGKPVEVDFFARLRDITRFDSVDALRAQIARDVEQTLAITSP